MAGGKQSIILLSKLQAPQTKTKLLYRERLVNLLKENLNKRVVLLCAGAGYGKTTLLSQFLSQVEIPYVYYHLERTDAEPVVFFSYLIAGIGKIIPDFGKQTEKLSNFFNYPQRYMEMIVGTFINEVIEKVKHDLYIILEDYHTLYPSEQINNILAYMLNHLPPNLHLIITSRILPPISMSQLQARDELFEIDSQHLRFTKEEIRSLFSTVYSVSLTETELEWIEEHFEGWPTSLRLMLQSSDYLKGKQSVGYIKRILDSYYQSQSNLFNYFAQEIYNQEPKPTRQFMVDCSVLEWLRPELCDAVTRRTDSAELLADLNTRNAFVFRIPGMGYRLHNLFRDFLQSKLVGTSREKRLFVRAARYYLKENRLEDAVNFYLNADEFEKAASIIQEIGPDFIGQGRSSIVSGFIERIPKRLRAHHPLLLMRYAQSLIYSGRTDEARRYCQKAVRSLSKKQRARSAYADALYQLGGIYLNQGKLTTAKKWYLKALKVCPRNARIVRASILNSIGSVYNAMGGRYLARATPYFEEALALARRGEFKGLEASIMNNLAMHEYKAGNLMSAGTQLTQMAEFLKEHFSPGCGSGFYNAALVNLLLGHEERARMILDDGMSACNEYNDLWSTARIWEGYAMLHQYAGDYKEARQLAVKALEVYEKLGVVKLIINVLNDLVRTHILSGALVEAERDLSKMWVLKGNRNDPEAIPLLLTEAKLDRARGRYDDAERGIKTALRQAQRYKQQFNIFLLNLELVRLLADQDRRSESLNVLEKAIMLSKAKGYDVILLRELMQEQEILKVVRYEKIEKSYIMSVIRNSDLDVQWIDGYVFGMPRVIVNDEPIPEKAWTTMKAKKLFFFLLLRASEQINQDVLIDALWHDASYKGGTDNIRKAVQHIRQILRPYVGERYEVIVSGRGLYRISPHAMVWLDSEELQRLLGQAKKLAPDDERREKILEKAIELYRDGFAPGWYDSWVEEMRRFFDRLHEECLDLLSEYYVKTERYAQAITCYRKAIAVNCYNEEYHRQMMTLLAKTGRHKEAVEHYEQLRSRLKKELNSEPQEETNVLYKKLLKQNSQNR